MELLIMAVATAFNIIIIKHKFEKGTVADAIFDLIILAAMSWVFGGTMGGMMIATSASALVSLYLLKYPVKLEI